MAMPVDWKTAVERPWVCALSFACLTASLILPLCFQTEDDWDVSLYLVVADQWVQGHAPYTVVFDNKPPGIYALYALALSVWHSILAIRVLSWLVAFGTSFVVYKIVVRMERMERGSPSVAGFAAGCLYACFAAANGGNGGQTEIFVACLSSLAMLAVLRAADRIDENRSTLLLALAGLAFGAAVTTKQTALFDCAAASVVYGLAWLGWFRRKPGDRGEALARALVHVLVAGFSLLVVPLLTLGLFEVTGHFDEMWTATYEANRARTVGQPFNVPVMLSMLVLNVRSQPAPWLFTAGATIMALRLRSTLPERERRVLGAALIWFATVLVCMLLVMRTALYEHYFLQLAAPAAVAGGWVFARLIAAISAARAAGGAARLQRATLLALLTLVLLTDALPNAYDSARFIFNRGIRGDRFWGDKLAHLASELNSRMPAGASIYVVDTSPILYFLTRAKLPTRYVFPPLLIGRQDMPDITSIDRVQEVERIFDQHPALVVRSREWDPLYTQDAAVVLGHVRQRLDADYERATSVAEFDIYQRRTP